MKSTEAILASDYPFLEPDRQRFVRKQHHDFWKRLFRALICGLIPFRCPEISTISNATSDYLSKYVLEPVLRERA
jgi:hypothetical protein